MADRKAVLEKLDDLLDELHDLEHDGTLAAAHEKGEEIKRLVAAALGVAAPLDVDALARAAGFSLESWMTNPPRPAMWHGTPEAMRKLIEAAPGVASGSEASADTRNEGANDGRK